MARVPSVLTSPIECAPLAPAPRQRSLGSVALQLAKGRRGDGTVAAHEAAADAGAPAPAAAAGSVLASDAMSVTASVPTPTRLTMPTSPGTPSFLAPIRTPTPTAPTSTAARSPVRSSSLADLLADLHNRGTQFNARAVLEDTLLHAAGDIAPPTRSPALPGVVTDHLSHMVLRAKAAVRRARELARPPAAQTPAAGDASARTLQRMWGTGACVHACVRMHKRALLMRVRLCTDAPRSRGRGR